MGQRPNAVLQSLLPKAGSSTRGLVDFSRREFLKTSSRMALGVTVLTSFPFLLKSNTFSERRVVKRAVYSMGTVVTITAVGETGDLCNEAITAAFDEMRLINELMSVFDEKSQLSCVNQNAGRSAVNVDQRIIDVVEASLEFNEVTDGAFDITIEPLMRLWGFRKDGRNERPHDRDFHRVLDAVGSHNILLDKKGSTLGLMKENASLDPGGIAVGYSVDRVVKILKAKGIESALINHSGDIYAMGAPPGEDGWLIGIRDPLHTDHILTSVRVTDRAVSTSGNYANFVDLEGHRYGHIVNPRTGKRSFNTLSATVIAASAIQADAFSTGIYVLGVEKGLKLAQSRGNVDFIAVTLDGESEKVISTI